VSLLRGLSSDRQRNTRMRVAEAPTSPPGRRRGSAKPPRPPKKSATTMSPRKHPYKKKRTPSLQDDVPQDDDVTLGNPFGFMVCD
jgi:hypothetical protein